MVTADRAALFAAAATPYHCHSAGDTGGSERYCQRAGRLWRSAFLFPPDCPAQDGGAFLNGDCQHVCKHYGLHIVAQKREATRGCRKFAALFRMHPSPWCGLHPSVTALQDLDQSGNASAEPC